MYLKAKTEIRDRNDRDKWSRGTKVGVALLSVFIVLTFGITLIL